MKHTPVTSDSELLLRSLPELPEPELMPTFIVVSGLPGTGKTYLSRKLAERLPFLVLESDALRKVLFSPPAYTAAESQHLFQAVHRLIEGLLQRGIPIILDATNLSEQYRERLYNIAEHRGAKLILVRVEAPPGLVKERLRSRIADRDPDGNSDADWAIYQKMKPGVQKIRRQHYAVDTSGDITPIIDKIVREASR